MGNVRLGIQNVMSVYIILGIGVDDLFVLFDAFIEEGIQGNIRVSERMDIALKRAGQAMFITSFTTALSFLSNLFTIIPVIQSFVALMAILVIMNYLLVVFIFPVTIIVWQVHVREALNRLGSGAVDVFVEGKLGIEAFHKQVDRLKLSSASLSHEKLRCQPCQKSGSIITSMVRMPWSLGKQRRMTTAILIKKICVSVIEASEASLVDHLDTCSLGA